MVEEATHERVFVKVIQNQFQENSTLFTNIRGLMKKHGFEPIERNIDLYDFALYFKSHHTNEKVDIIFYEEKYYIYKNGEYFTHTEKEKEIIPRLKILLDPPLSGEKERRRSRLHLLLFMTLIIGSLAYIYYTNQTYDKAQRVCRQELANVGINTSNLMLHNLVSNEKYIDFVYNNNYTCRYDLSSGKPTLSY